ncbi:M48 family metallopeptidase [Caldimonas brevitalea]|uniref:Zn-dependent protease with chaperone function n=1 Tax=Caldimonas brevitalea TaxID=413882 RepID=A0A0G3BG35_9BURK|nr:M48 family metallopeptidase [Caldimonas brevitalea]AKJ26928.1 Zn-dependent protease with chaperone function [Caldimonas brevitalea]
MSAPALQLDYYDGRSARPRRVAAHLSHDTLYLRGDGLVRSVAASQVRWPERSRGATRIAHLPDGGTLHCSDASAWDTWARASGLRETLMSRAQHSWRWVAACLALLVVLVVAIYQWGLPWASQGVVALLPDSVDQAMGDAAYASFGDQLLKPSRLPAAQRQRLQQAFGKAVAQAYPDGNAPHYRLMFHKSEIGPNAFALPGGVVVLTDELVELVDGDVEAVVGVLAHELGHVERRHGMRSLVQVTLLSTLSSLAFGDFSGWLATAPVLLGQAGYSRDAEREADRISIRILQAAGISPLAMVRFFDKIAPRAGDRESSVIGIAFASHPPDEERVAAFREAAQAEARP